MWAYRITKDKEGNIQKKIYWHEPTITEQKPLEEQAQTSSEPSQDEIEKLWVYDNQGGAALHPFKKSEITKNDRKIDKEITKKLAGSK